MTDQKLQRARQLIAEKPYLVWSTSDYKNLSAQSIVENVLSHGNWDDFQYIKNLFGVKETNKVFQDIVGKKRKNLRPETIHYFTEYFKRHA